MKRPAGWEKRLLLTLFITLFLILMTQTPAMALFGPKIVDVTTKSFSVVWTTGGNYNSCDIILYASSSSSTPMNLDPSQKIIETDPNGPGEAGKNFRIAKVTIVGLNVDTVYYFRLKQDTNWISDKISVRTAKLRGLTSTEPNDNDIVSNDIVHKAVYQSDGTSPAIGALVLADIYEYNVDPESAPNNTKNYYPVSAWVGDGMIGDADDNTYNPNNISYQKYAALNLNNLFERVSHYPLSLNGDDPNTTANDSEIIKFTIVHGIQPILGGSTDPIISYGRVEYVEKSGGEKITTARVSASFKLTEGLNNFAIPTMIQDGYNTRKLLQDIDIAEDVGLYEKGPVSWIYLWDNINQTYKFPTYKTFDPFTGDPIIQNPWNLQAGQGCFIDMDSSMTEELIYYGSAESATCRLKKGMNLITFPQLPDYYSTADLFRDIEAVLGTNSVQFINSYNNKLKKWDFPTYKSIDPFTGEESIVNSTKMFNHQFYFGIINTELEIPDWNPFSD